jgi:hypothetical protein
LVETEQIVGVGARSEGKDVLRLFIGEIEQLARLRIARCAAAHLGDHEIAKMAEHVLRDVRQIEPLLRHAIDHAEARRRISIDERRGEIVQHFSVGYAEHARDVVARQRRAAERDDLIEEAHRVAHRARGLAREHGDRRVVGDDRLVGEHLAESLGDRLRRDELEVVALAATQNGDGDLVDLGRREDELHVGRRLFERLQERVPRLVRQHVHFVDDVDLEAVARRAERDALLQLSHLLPTPRTPVKRNAWATRLVAIALASVRATCS